MNLKRVWSTRTQAIIAAVLVTVGFAHAAQEGAVKNPAREQAQTKTTKSKTKVKPGTVRMGSFTPARFTPATLRPATITPGKVVRNPDGTTTITSPVVTSPVVTPPVVTPPVIRLPEVTSPEVQVYGDKNTTIFRLSADVLFDFDKSNIRTDANASLQEISAAIAANYPGKPLIIAGHTDAKGADAYNMGLSERRAQSVKQWLTTKGNIAANAAVTRGYGEKQPVAPNTLPGGGDNPDGRQKNRRVDIIVRR